MEWPDSLSSQNLKEMATESREYLDNKIFMLCDLEEGFTKALISLLDMAIITVGLSLAFYVYNTLYYIFSKITTLLALLRAKSSIGGSFRREELIFRYQLSLDISKLFIDFYIHMVGISRFAPSLFRAIKHNGTLRIINRVAKSYITTLGERGLLDPSLIRDIEGMSAQLASHYSETHSPSIVSRPLTRLETTREVTLSSWGGSQPIQGSLTSAYRSLFRPVPLHYTNPNNLGHGSYSAPRFPILGPSQGTGSRRSFRLSPVVFVPTVPLIYSYYRSNGTLVNDPTRPLANNDRFEQWRRDAGIPINPLNLRVYQELADTNRRRIERFFSYFS